MRYYSKKKNNSRVQIKKILLLFIAIIVAISLLNAVDIYRNRNKIFSGISAFGVELGGLKKKEAQEILQPIAAKIVDSPRILVFEDKEFKFLPRKELNAFIDLNRVVEETYSITRTGNIFRRIKDRIIVWRKGFEVPFQTELNPQRFEDFQGKVSSLINRSPGDA
ncbi:MAG: peptidoglycan binding domain-containing protein, partial [Atribacterota bacterium]